MFDKKALHHAYFIEGDKDAVLAGVEAFLKDAFKIERQGNPDVHFAYHESLGIDESRALQEMQSMKPVFGDKKIFIIAVSSITNEAQNALLKTFEEPTPGTHFFVTSPSERILLPTLRSRMVVVKHESSGENQAGEQAKKFLKLSPKEKLEFVAPIIEEKDKAKAESFLQALISEIAGKKGAQENPEALKEMLSLVRYLKDRSPSLKLILERVALLNL